MKRFSGKAKLKYGTVNCLSTEYVSRPIFTAAGEEIVFGRAVDRLAAYEDTGLEPEEVAALSQAEKDGRLVVLKKREKDG